MLLSTEKKSKRRHFVKNNDFGVASTQRADHEILNMHNNEEHTPLITNVHAAKQLSYLHTSHAHDYFAEFALYIFFTLHNMQWNLNYIFAIQLATQTLYTYIAPIMYESCIGSQGALSLYLPFVYKVKPVNQGP